MDLRGQKILITRQRAESLIAMLQAKGAKVFHVPCIELVEPDDWKPFDQAAKNQNKYSTLLFTSQEAVARTFLRLKQLSLNLSPHFKIAVVGPKTEDALNKEGFEANYIPKDYQAEGLIELFQKQQICKQQIWFPRAFIAREDLIHSLSKVGHKVSMTPCYQNIIPTKNQKKLYHTLEKGIDWVLFASSSSVINFLELYGRPKTGKNFPKIASIGKVTTIELAKNHLSADLTAKIQTLDGLILALEEYKETK